MQARAIRSGVLPEVRTSFQQGRWLFIAAAGALFALFGVALRLFASPPRPPEPAPASVSEPAPRKPVISYGAREAGERAQILRSIDFETLQRGGWLEPVDADASLYAQVRVSTASVNQEEPAQRRSDAPNPSVPEPGVVKVVPGSPSKQRIPSLDSEGEHFSRVDNGD